MRASWLCALVMVVGVVDLCAACSTSVALQRVGGKCEYDEQCERGLVCKCVARRNPDDEGPDEILAPGTCQAQAFTCKKTDAGPADVATDSVVDAPVSDAPVSDAPLGDASPEVADGGAPDALAAPDSSSAADAADGG